MYKILIAVIILMFTFVGGASLASAQQGVQNGSYNQAPVNNNPGNIAGITDNGGNGFDLRWLLLPLLAVPLFFLFKRNKKENDRTIEPDQGYAGSKGGESKVINDEDAL